MTTIDPATIRGASPLGAAGGLAIEPGSVAAELGRASSDRRSRPTPMLSRHWLRGRRRGGRRNGETRNVYVDRYSKEECLLATWLFVAMVADLSLTIVHLKAGGEEANPVMDWFLAKGGIAAFAAAKVAITLGATFFLLLHARFFGTRPALWSLGLLYAGVMGFHVVAYLDRT